MTGSGQPRLHDSDRARKPWWTTVAERIVTVLPVLAPMACIYGVVVPIEWFAIPQGRAPRVVLDDIFEVNMDGIWLRSP
ncbi:hypothetical protein [Nocardia sp. NPDC020380]|uniref:hypothetical protein n=1 Tax=Nocardia sp. NPDC020380 TaxID=3364309 RepID=UPI0037AC3CEE